MDDNFEKLLRAKEVCGVLNVSRRTLSRICENNAIAYVSVKGSYRFHPSAVQSFLDQNSVGRAEICCTSENSSISTFSPFNRLFASPNSSRMACACGPHNFACNNQSQLECGRVVFLYPIALHQFSDSSQQVNDLNFRLDACLQFLS